MEGFPISSDHIYTNITTLPMLVALFDGGVLGGVLGTCCMNNTLHR